MITQDWTAEQKERFIAMLRDFLEWSEAPYSSFIRDQIDDATTLEDFEWITTDIQAACELNLLDENEALSLIVSAQVREIVR